MSKSSLERAFLMQWRALSPEFPDPIPEYRFVAHHVGLGKDIRKRVKATGWKDWQADFCWPTHKLIVELEGGTLPNNEKRGRHVRHEGYKNDCLKYNAAQRLGYVVLRYTSDIVMDDFWSILDDISYFLSGGTNNDHRS